MVKPIFTIGPSPDARAIREEVFIKEQGAVNEFDEADSLSWSLVLYLDDVPIGTGRLLRIDPSKYMIGRIAVRKPFRHQKVGSYLMAFLERKAAEVGATHIELHAQCSAIPFYEKNGYHILGDGEIYYEEGIPHQTMGKTLPRPKKRRYYGRKKEV